MDAGPKVLGLKAMPKATPNAGGLRPSVGRFGVAERLRHN